MEIIDLRSDTLTVPSPEMREVMASADVGDDVFGEDPTINKLQDKIAAMTGKEAALFTASGTQANQTAINVHTQPGDEIICEKRSHIFNYEAGAAAALSGAQLHTLSGRYGILDPDEVELAVRPADHHYAQTRLIALENTHNTWGGTIYPIDEIKKIRVISDKYNLKMHLDGARLWNASAASGISIKEYAGYFDSVALCFSKGLGAPVGSIIAGSKEFIDRAHYYRKLYGGGMRQAGILAAAAIFAVENNFERLTEDHRRARLLAEQVNQLPGFVVNLQTVQTNIVIIDTSLNAANAIQITSDLAEKGVKVIPFSPTRFRMVTNMHITDEQIEQVIDVMKNLYKK